MLGAAGILVAAACASFGAGDASPDGDGGAEATAPVSGPDGAPAACGTSDVPDAAPDADCLGNGLKIDLQSDDGNCGRCGRSCRGDGCATGLCVPQPLGTGPASLVDLTASRLYYVDSASGSAFARELPPSTNVVPLGIPPPDGGSYGVIMQIIEDGDRLWFDAQGAIGWVPKDTDGGAPPTIVLANANDKLSLAVDATYLYYRTDRAVVRVLKDGTNPTSFLEADPGTRITAWGFASGREAVWWSVTSDMPPTFTLHTRTMGGSSVLRAEGLAGVASLAADDTYIYWLDMNDRFVMRARRGAADPPEIAARWPDTGQNTPSLLAVDASFLYWAVASELSAGAMTTYYRSPVCGGEVEVFARMQPFGPMMLGVDRAFVGGPDVVAVRK